MQDHCRGQGQCLRPWAAAVARTLVDADAYAVARIEEALMPLLRRGQKIPSCCWRLLLSAADLPVLAANNLQTAVHAWEQLEALEQAELPAPWWPWLKLDTGMHRLGVRAEEMPAFIERLAKCKNVVQPFNVMTRFSRSDELEQPTTREQIDLFSQLTAPLLGERAMANSAGILAWPVPTATGCARRHPLRRPPFPIRWRRITTSNR